MRIKTIWFVVILLLVATIIINFSFDKEEKEFKPLELNVGDEFTGINYPNAMIVLNYAISDVTGDGEKDMIIVIGEKGEDSIIANKVDIVVYDTTKKSFYKAGLKNFSGKNPKILLSDLTANGVDDILVILENEDNTQTIRVISMNKDALKEIFTARDNRGLVFVGEMIDGIKAHLRCGKISKEMYVDLSDKKQDYLQTKKVDESGKIICENKKIMTTGFTNVELVTINEQKGIQTTQRICAFEEKEIIDELTVIWKYEDGKWQMKEAKGIKVGNLMFN